MNEWVKCKDRFPNDKRLVPVTGNYEGAEIWMAGYNGKRWFDAWWDYVPDDEQPDAWFDIPPYSP